VPKENCRNNYFGVSIGFGDYLELSVTSLDFFLGMISMQGTHMAKSNREMRTGTGQGSKMAEAHWSYWGPRKGSDWTGRHLRNDQSELPLSQVLTSAEFHLFEVTLNLL
jgi:hypothetical protein